MIVLGIETSCDETAVALVDGARRVHADLVLSQLDAHRAYGGVVPEIAARSHIDHLDRLVAQAMAEAGLDFQALSGVAVTAGPGLIGGVMVGLMTAKAIAAVHDLPLIAVNHLEAHALSARLQAEIDFPFLVLLISGGHCQWLVAKGVGSYQRLGTTLDDAIGEAFDKSARLLGLGYPGGPALERAAEAGDPKRFDLPRPLRGRAGCDFSFSGLKTAVGGRVAALGGTEALSAQDRADLAAGVQAAIADVLVDRLAHAVTAFRERHPNGRHLVVAGGVAANATLRARLNAAAEAHGLVLNAPPPDLCTDNAVMVAWAGLERLGKGLVDGLDVPARARWPLDPTAAPAIGAGVKA